MPQSKSNVPKRRKVLPALCNIIGIVILLLCIAVSVPLSIPGMLGYQAFHITSGSMEPALPVGSLVYVDSTPGQDIQEGDIIAFYSGNSLSGAPGGEVIIHRVTKNRVFEGAITTKGDANDTEDISEVAYGSVIGVVRKSFPYLGEYLTVFSTTAGRIYVLLFAACGILFNVLAGRLRGR